MNIQAHDARLTSVAIYEILNESQVLMLPKPLYSLLINQNNFTTFTTTNI